MTSELTALRQRAIAMIVVGGWSVTALLLALGMVQETGLLALALVSALMNLPPTRWALITRGDARVCVGVAIMAAVQPALLVCALQGSGWQGDLYPGFFTALTVLTLLGDRRALWIGAATMIVTDIALALLAPQWLMPVGSGVASALIHSAAIALAAALLSGAVQRCDRTLRALQQSAELSQRQAKELRVAQETAEAERRKRHEVNTEILKARKAEYAHVAADFERTVNSFTHSVASTARLLEQATKALDEVASETHERASKVVGSAEAATTAARTVAHGVAELSGSIAAIAVNVSQQKELTSRATERAANGGEAVGSLAERSDTIGEATRAIVRIAERTNLLSLNAAIEAASAGSAGRGFTIVAQEVKALARQAAQAATGIDSLLSGVRTGTLEAERSFAAIDAVVAQLDRAAIAIRCDVEMQRKSADLIESYARRAADDVDAVAQSSRSLATAAQTARQLVCDLDRAAAQLLDNVRDLEASADSFAGHLRSA
jgi:methyl-accepting chemotaxis protein